MKGRTKERGQVMHRVEQGGRKGREKGSWGENGISRFLYESCAAVGGFRQ